MNPGRVMRRAIPLLIGIALALPAGADEPQHGLYYRGWDRGGGLRDGLAGPGSWYGGWGHGFAGHGGFGGDYGLDGDDGLGGDDRLGGQDEFGGHGGLGGLGGGGRR